MKSLTLFLESEITNFNIHIDFNHLMQSVGLL